MAQFSSRRVDQLKAVAFACGFTNEDASRFGNLAKTSTWEALLELYLVDGETIDILLERFNYHTDDGDTLQA